MVICLRSTQALESKKPERIALASVAFALIVATALVNDAVAHMFNRGAIVLSLEPRSLMSFMCVAVPVALLSSMITRKNVQT